MHELGLMTGVLDNVTQVAKEQKVLSVNKINLQVGAMSGVVVPALEFAFQQLQELEEYQLCKQAKLHIDELTEKENRHKFEIVSIEADLC